MARLTDCFAELAGSRVRGSFLPLVDVTELAGTLIVVGMGVWAFAAVRNALTYMTLVVEGENTL